MNTTSTAAEKAWITKQPNQKQCILRTKERMLRELRVLCLLRVFVTTCMDQTSLVDMHAVCQLSACIRRGSAFSCGAPRTPMCLSPRWVPVYEPESGVSRAI